MNLAIQQRANQLVGAAGAAGIVVGFGEAVRALRRYGNQFDRAFQFIARNARRDRAGNIQSRLNQNLGLNNDRMIVPSKRRRFVGPTGGAQQKAPRGNVAPSGYQAVTYCKTTLGKRKKQSLLSTVARRVREGEKDLIGRWQSLLSPQPTSLSLLTKPFANGKVTDGRIFTSCYCFNLSAPAFFPNESIATLPMYRLVKDTAAAGAARSWNWVPESGIRNNPEGNTSSSPEVWQVEHNELYTGYGIGYRHDWSDVRLLLQGAVKYPTRVHIYQVMFPMDGIGPVRYSKTGAAANVANDINPTDLNDVNEADYFWERFMEPKIVHPFANTKKTGLMDRKHLMVLHHEVINLNSEVTITSDVQSLQHIKRMFIRNGTEYNLESAQNVELSLMPVGGVNGIKGDGAVGFANATEYLSTVNFPLRSKDRWLLIVAENYQQTGDYYDPDIAIDANNTPSFDICVRSKYTMYAK